MGVCGECEDRWGNPEYNTCWSTKCCSGKVGNNTLSCQASCKKPKTGPDGTQPQGACQVTCQDSGKAAVDTGDVTTGKADTGDISGKMLDLVAAPSPLLLVFVLGGVAGAVVAAFI